MYNFIDVDHPAIAIVYSLMLVILGNFFLMNLILAVIMDTYVIIQERDVKKKLKKEKINTIYIDEDELNIRAIGIMEQEGKLEMVDNTEKMEIEEDEEDGQA